MEIDARAHFRSFGFVVLRAAFEPAPLAREIDEALGTAAGSALEAAVGSAAIRFGYVPLMTARSPTSLQLLDRLEAVAIELMGGPVLPTRAKGVRYTGDTPWHADSDEPDVASMGFAAYLEPLRSDSGALRVLPGSHRRGFGEDLRVLGAVGLSAAALPAHTVATEPGDVIAFDEHLFHASANGGVRRQWRLDFVRDPGDADEAVRVKEYFARIFPPDWDGGYDVDAHPSYGSDWLSSGRHAVARLAELGVYDLAARQEAFARSRRLGARQHVT
jgi:hypothetical protein